MKNLTFQISHTKLTLQLFSCSRSSQVGAAVRYKIQIEMTLLAYLKTEQLIDARRNRHPSHN